MQGGLLAKEPYTQYKKNIFKARIRFPLYPSTVPATTMSAQNTCYYW